MLYIYSKYAAMSLKEKETSSRVKRLDPRESIRRAGEVKGVRHSWVIVISTGRITWGSQMERIAIIRQGIPYECIEILGQKAGITVKQMLQNFGMAQTTYNKKKRDDDLMSGRDTELVLVLSEVLDFGLEVFNNEEEKFQRWLKKSNVSLGGASPASMFDSLSGIQEIRNALCRLEFGNMA